MKAHTSTTMEPDIVSTKRPSRSKLICLICGDTARGMNFDVLTYMSYKAFFRRNALQPSRTRRCPRKSFCNITKQTRSSCPACRLRKCYAWGMNPLLIRLVSESETGSNILQQFIITKQRQIQLPAPKPLGLLQNDRSSLTTDQWDLLSNIIRSYDEQNLILRVQCLLNETSSLPPKLRSKVDNTLNIMSQPITGIQPLAEHSSHFHHLSNYARRAIILHNVFFTDSLNGYFVARETGAFYNSDCTTALSVLYGSDYVLKCIRDNERLEQNGNLIKLMLFVLIFSSSCSMVEFSDQEDVETMSSSIELVHIQNVYVTMLWKYLVYICGCDQAALRFASLVKRVTDILYRADALSKNLIHNAFVDRIVKQAERSLAMSD